MLTDTHCHLFYDDMKNDLPAVLDRAAELGVNRFICVATNMEDARDCLLLSETYDNVFASAGVHPHDAKDVTEDYIEQIYYLMTFDSMVAVGEMGLDYFRNISDPVTQIRVFREQMSIAQEMDKPVIFHNRNADEDTIKVLSEFSDVIGVAHCFSSNLETATAFLDMGYYISFAGNLTFKNSHLPEVAKEVPFSKTDFERSVKFSGNGSVPRVKFPSGSQFSSITSQPNASNRVGRAWAPAPFTASMTILKFRR